MKMRAFKELAVTAFRFSRSSFRCSSKLVSCPEIATANEFCLDNYDAIGFDFDHTICKYKLPALFNLIYDSLAKYLVESCSYPKFLLEKHAVDPHWVQKGIILDKARGNFLKLDKDWKITKAYHGTSEMSKDAVITAYGPKCMWEESMNIPQKMCSNIYLEEPFYIFKDYFTTIGAALCARVVDHLDAVKGPIPYYVVFDHYLSALYHIYGRENFKRNVGFYFPTLKSNPRLYIETCCPKLRHWLCDIHKQKKLFLLTSAHSDVFRFLAEICIGEDWRDYFDVVITYAKKPSFFTERSPFYALKDDQETNVVSVQQMKSSEIYSQGNWSDLSHLLGRLCDSGAPKVLYIGDSMVEDVFAPSHFVGLDTVAIVEEMSAEDSMYQHVEDKHILHTDKWGSFFNVQSNGKINQSLWSNLLSENSRIAVPSLNKLSSLELTDKIPAFSASSPFAGYFPSIPSSFQSLL